MIHRFTLIERILLRMNVLPHPMLDGLNSVIAGRALQVSGTIGLLDQFEQPTSVHDAAVQLGIDEPGTRALVGVLESLGYLSRNSGDIYSFSPRGRKFLARSSPDSMRNLLEFSSSVYEGFTKLEASLRGDGAPGVDLGSFSAKDWATFTGAMLEIARTNAAEVVKAIPMASTDRRVLDLGGSHGLYSILLCQRASRLTADVLDYEAVREYALKTVEQFGMLDRVAFRAGNVMKDDLGTGYDLVLAFNLIHGFSSSENGALARRVFASLNERGRFVVLDQVREAAGSSELSRLVSSSIGLLLFHQTRGRTYSDPEIGEWLQAAGFTRTGMKKLRTPGFALVIGTK